MTSALHTTNTASNPIQTNRLIAVVAVIAALAAVVAMAVMATRDGASSTPGPAAFTTSAAAGPNADLAVSWATAVNGIPAAGPNVDIAQGAQR